MIEVNWLYVTLFVGLLCFHITKLRQKIWELEKQLRDLRDDVHENRECMNSSFRQGGESIRDNRMLKKQIDTLRIEKGYMRDEIQTLHDKISLLKHLSEIFFGKSV